MSSRQIEDQYEVALAVRHVVRLRCRQGESAVEAALREAAGLDWRFCVNCGAETEHEGSVCIGCGQRSVAPVCLKPSFRRQQDCR